MSVTLAAIAVLGASWWLGVRHRFQGPPAMSIAKDASASPLAASDQDVS